MIEKYCWKEIRKVVKHEGGNRGVERSLISTVRPAQKRGAGEGYFLNLFSPGLGKKKIK